MKDVYQLRVQSTHPALANKLAKLLFKGYDIHNTDSDSLQVHTVVEGNSFTKLCMSMQAVFQVDFVLSGFHIMQQLGILITPGMCTPGHDRVVQSRIKLTQDTREF